MCSEGHVRGQVDRRRVTTRPQVPYQCRDGVVQEQEVGRRLAPTRPDVRADDGSLHVPSEVGRPSRPRSAGCSDHARAPPRDRAPHQMQAGRTASRSNPRLPAQGPPQIQDDWIGGRLSVMFAASSPASCSRRRGSGPRSARPPHPQTADPSPRTWKDRGRAATTRGRSAELRVGPVRPGLHVAHEPSRIPPRALFIDVRGRQAPVREYGREDERLSEARRPRRPS